MITVTDFARQILEMEAEIMYLREELERLQGYEKKYNDLLVSSMNHDQIMMGNYITALVDKVKNDPREDYIQGLINEIRENEGKNKPG